MKFELEPIDHVPPLKRIETAPQYTPAPVMTPGEQVAEAAARTLRQIEGERIWKLVRQCAQGTNLPPGRHGAEAGGNGAPVSEGDSSAVFMGVDWGFASELPQADVRPFLDPWPFLSASEVEQVVEALRLQMDETRKLLEKDLPE